MAKAALQFRHNGRDVAIFVDGGTNLLVALRELIGDMTPKFGCGQGGCGTCSVLVDGELHLSCLTLAETVARNAAEALTQHKLRRAGDYIQTVRGIGYRFAAPSDVPESPSA